MNALAQQLHEYMTYRAKEEGQAYDLDAPLFEAYLKAGLHNFFGIVTNGKDILRDSQKPEILKKWKSVRHVQHAL